MQTLLMKIYSVTISALIRSLLAQYFHSILTFGIEETEYQAFFCSALAFNVFNTGHLKVISSHFVSFNKVNVVEAIDMCKLEKFPMFLSTAALWFMDFPHSVYLCHLSVTILMIEPLNQILRAKVA